MFDDGVRGDVPRCSGISCTPHNEFCTEITSSKSADDARASVPAAVTWNAENWSTGSLGSPPQQHGMQMTQSQPPQLDFDLIECEESPPRYPAARKNVSVNVDDLNEFDFIDSFKLDTLQSQAFTESLLIGIKARSLDVENYMVRHYARDRHASLDVGTYTDTCYWEFLELLHNVGWSTWSALVHESKHLMIL